MIRKEIVRFYVFIYIYIYGISICTYIVYVYGISINVYLRMIVNMYFLLIVSVYEKIAAFVFSIMGGAKQKAALK